ncbi:hypothetical protein [Sphingomonas sp. PvP018]|nr:hypothetical protein [Sphingomonas sp. PvP018]MBP2513406.1 hypothetical protein [Sphingomonas sp. PvP018]
MLYPPEPVTMIIRARPCAHFSLAAFCAPALLAASTGAAAQTRSAEAQPVPGATAIAGATSAAIPAIPEPMIFDMVRPLGARRGELETNTLAQVNLSGPSRHVEWAPEVEYAVADGFAVELELPFTDGRLTDLKMGLQGTFGTFRGGRSIHGVQYLGLHNRRDGGWSSSLVYLLGNRFGERLSTMTMIGAGDVTLRSTKGTGLIVNHSTFWDVDDGTVLGFEVNRQTGASGHWLLMPQLHRAIGRKVSAQIGAGAERAVSGPFRPRVGLRIIREF